MRNTKLTLIEIEERKAAIKSAEIIASLDNNSKYSDDWIAAKEKWIKGEISDKELKEIAFRR